MKKLIPAILIFMICNYGFSQEETSEEEIKMIYSFFFEMNKEVFKEPTYAYKEVPIDINEEFGANVISSETINSILDSLQKNAVIKIEYGLIWKNLMLKAEFPRLGEGDGMVDGVEVSLIDTKIYEKDVPVEIQEIEGVTVYEGDNNFFDINEETSNDDYRSLSLRNEILSEIQNVNDVTGSAEYAVQFMTGYETVELSKQDIGKKFKLGGNEYLLIDIFQNKVVIDELTEEAEEEIMNIELINLSEDGKHRQVPYSATELAELKEKDERYKDVEVLPFDKIEIFEDNYKIFKNHLDITIEEYKELLPYEEFKELEDQNEYVVLLSPAPVENTFILYKLVFGTEKEIKVAL
ncbi:hypothetical protein OOZ15_05140 [Galbibacter sp. EGI 63066]|uniref:hypothetical protein n=1 Tax=Galbibacter sp. EGI 63066 TaxID=2993559 RepID=UPI00224966D6|nr:hypothetical protein [Galbibacter sp. EGI 63066]MCX2679320.1 hypothetical protein [Galbibacter sp. EGI 63066]